MSPMCDFHADTIHEIAAATATVVILDKRIESLSSKIDNLSSKLDTMLGRMQPTIDSIDKLCKEQGRILDDLKLIGNEAAIAKAEAITVKQTMFTEKQFLEYRQGHNAVHKTLIWAFGIITAGVGVQASLAIAKAIGWI